MKDKFYHKLIDDALLRDVHPFVEIAVCVRKLEMISLQLRAGQQRYLEGLVKFITFDCGTDDVNNILDSL
jgi:hypothetical protein